MCLVHASIFGLSSKIDGEVEAESYKSVCGK